MKIAELEPGRIYIDHRARARPGYYLVLDTSTTYKPERRDDVHIFVATNTLKSYSSSRGVLCLRSLHPDLLEECATFISPSYYAEVSTIDSMSVNAIIRLELSRRRDRTITGISLSVINQKFLSPLT